MRHLIAVALGLALAAPAVAGAPPEQPILDADQACSRASAEKGLEGFLSCFAPDATVLVPGEPPVTGKDAIRKSLGPGFAGPFRLTWQPLKAEAARAGDLGYSFGTFSLEGTTPEGKKTTATGKYASVWRKQADGTWKIIVDIGNRNPPEPSK